MFTKLMFRLCAMLTVGLSLVQAHGSARFTVWLCEQVTTEDVVRAPKLKRSELPEISGGYDAMYAQLRAARQNEAV